MLTYSNRVFIGHMFQSVLVHSTKENMFKLPEKESILIYIIVNQKESLIKLPFMALFL